MKTRKHKTTVALICALLVLLTSVSSAQAYPPDNAAVLYYQAFLIMKEPGKDIKELMARMRKGEIKSNDAVKQCVAENRRVIELMETAAAIPNCDWGHDDSKGFDLLLPELGKIRQTAFLLAADAQILAEQGEHQAALNKCLTLHKMARHIGDDLLISFLVSASVNTLANERIQDVLSEMPADLDTLTWIKSQLVGIAGNTGSIKTAMNREKELAVQEIRREKVDALLASMGDELVNSRSHANTLAKVRQGDDRFFRDSRDYYTNAMTDTIRALDLPYQQSHQTLEAQGERISEEAKENPVAVLCFRVLPAAASVRSADVRNRTLFNAISAAIDVYLVRASTGQLPEKLPAGVPMDLFSGKDFAFNKTKNGFVLRCQAKDIDKDKVYQYDFRVAK